MSAAEPDEEGPLDVEPAEYEDVLGELVEARRSEDGLAVTVLVHGREVRARFRVPAKAATKAVRGLSRVPRLTRVMVMGTDLTRYEVVWWVAGKPPPKVLVSGMVPPWVARALMKYKKEEKLPTVSQAVCAALEEWARRYVQGQLSSSRNGKAPERRKDGGRS